MVHCAFGKVFFFLIKSPIPCWSNLTGPQVPVMQRNFTGSTELPFFSVPQQRISSYPSSPPPWCMTHLICMAVLLQDFPGGESNASISGEENGHSALGQAAQVGLSRCRFCCSECVIVVLHIFRLATMVWYPYVAYYSTRCTLNTNCFMLIAWVFYLLKL